MKFPIGKKSLALIKKYAASRQTAYRLPQIDISAIPDEVIIRECQKYADAVDNITTGAVVNYGFSSDAREALISFACDCGISALRQLSVLYFEDIPAAMLKYNTINGEVVDSLTQRRAEEYELLTGKKPPSVDDEDDEKEPSAGGDTPVTPPEGGKDDPENPPAENGGDDNQTGDGTE